MDNALPNCLLLELIDPKVVSHIQCLSQYSLLIIEIIAPLSFKAIPIFPSISISDSFASTQQSNPWVWIYNNLVPVHSPVSLRCLLVLTPLSLGLRRGLKVCVSSSHLLFKFWLARSEREIMTFSRC